MDRQIRPAHTDELGALIDLWERVFEDETALVERFNSLWPCDEHALLLCGDAIESALWDIETGRLTGPAVDTPINMVYALATHPEHRGKGAASALMAALPPREGLRCLTPAEDSLAGWYKKLGWEHFFYCDRGIAPYSGASGAKAERIDAEAYLKLREDHLSGRVHDVPNREALAWQSALHDTYGGGYFSVTAPHGICAANVTEDDSGIAVNELLCPPHARQAVLDALMNAFGCKKARWRAPAVMAPVPYAMVTAEAATHLGAVGHPWLGFVFD